MLSPECAVITVIFSGNWQLIKKTSHSHARDCYCTLLLLVFSRRGDVSAVSTPVYIDWKALVDDIHLIPIILVA